MLKYINLKHILCLASLVAVSLLSSCDDSSDGDSRVVLESFGPVGVQHGETIRFIGANLDKVTTIVFKPNVEVAASSFASHSSSLIEVVVPDAAEAGKVTLKTSAGDIESKTVLDFNVPVVIDNITAVAKPGTNITITGDKLNWVESITFTDGLLVDEADFVSQSANQIVVTVPMDAKTGFLTFVTGGTEPAEFDSEVPLEVILPEVTTLNPAFIRHAADLTLQGTDLDLVTEIKFPGGATVSRSGFKSQTEAAIVVAVPVTSTSGALTLTVASGVTVETPALTIILPNVTSLDPSNTASHNPGATLRLIGTDLDLVEKIKFPNVSTLVTNFTKTATEIEVVIPAGAVGGTLVLTTIHGFAVPVTPPFGDQLVLLRVIYDDAVQAPLGAGGGWGDVITDIANTENPRVGSKSVKVTFANTWGGGCQMGNWNGESVSTAGMSYYAFSIYGGPGTDGKEINVNVSGTQAQVVIEEGKWKDVQILLSSVGSPAGISEVWFQDRGWAGTVYIDHIGLK